ncbi:transcription factor Adf-1-like [Oreochromis niloticus]|uniref:transcription factor Adf-1-like n=1 Tax=Oreochromis niloticus TaxID=8128 RepID=UPI000904D8C9|nr:transcription factor Adf-1-like [Oreochromis niloticus]
MEEKLIGAVANRPELYDASCYFYRDRNKKDLAWRHISEEIGQPEDICRKKWKSLRDTYNKEKRTEKEKRSGSAAGSGRRWKFFAVMGFLDPFLTTRETSSNMVPAVENFAPEDQGQPGEAAGEFQSEESTDYAAEPSPAASSGSPVPGPSTPAAAPTGPQRRIAQKRPRDGSQDGPSAVELAILESLKRPRPSPTEYFLLGLAPALESLPPQTREFVKFQMHKLVFESSTAVLNLETLDPSDQ